MMFDSSMESDSLPVGRIHRQKKIPDFPAVITSRRKIDKHRHDAEQPNLRRVSLEKPQKPKLDEWLRRQSNAETKHAKKAATMSTAYGMGYGSEKTLLFKANLNALKSTHKVLQSGSVVSSSASNKSVISQASSKKSNVHYDAVSDTSKINKPSALTGKGNLQNQVPLYGMDLTFLEPFANVGLFSICGVSGSKARFSSADRLYRSGSHIDLSSSTRSSVCTDVFKLRRSSSLIDLEQFHGNIKKLSLSRNISDPKDKLNLEKSIKSKSDNRSPNSRKNAMNKQVKKYAQKLPLNGLKQKSLINSKTNKPSSKSKNNGVTQEEKKASSCETQLEMTYRRREITTQSSEGCEGQFEVVNYLSH